MDQKYVSEICLLGRRVRVQPALRNIRVGSDNGNGDLT